VDYTGSINRMRFDMVVNAVYLAVASAVSALLADAGVDAHNIDEIVYVGGTTCLPGLDDCVCLNGGFSEEIETPFSRGTVVGGGIGDPTTILARGCAFQAALISSISDSEAELREAFSHETKMNEVKATTRTLGVLFSNNSQEGKEVGGTWIPVIQKETALPARRIVSFDVELTDDSKRIAFEVWEVKEGIRVENVPPQSDDDEDEDEEDEMEVKHRTLSKEILLGSIETDSKLGIQIKGKSKDKGKWVTRVEVQFIVGIGGNLEVDLKEVGEGLDGATAQLRVPAP